MKKPLVFWFTGLSASGKTSIVKESQNALLKNNKKIKIYDGDAVRKQLNRHLTFTPEHIKENNRVIAELCLKDIRDNDYDYIFVSVISPFQESRDQARDVLGGAFYLVYCKVSLPEAIRRDPKGLYKKALLGKIENFIGVDKKVPYQPPEDADLILDTQKYDLKTCVDKFVTFINKKGESLT